MKLTFPNSVTVSFPLSPPTKFSLKLYTPSTLNPKPSDFSVNKTMSHDNRRDRNSPAGESPTPIDERHSKASKNSHHKNKTKKRKIVYEEENLTLKRCSVQCESSSSSSSKHFKSCQSSYQKKTKYDVNDSISKHVRRKWTYSDEDCSDFREKLVVVSYNILGVENASKHPYLYSKVPYKYMGWDHRRMLICKELTQYDPSILCFQEVDRFSDLHDVLQQDGFRGVYKARTGDACDGCATFWKDERFTLLHEESIEYQSYGLRNNVAQFCVLKMNGDRLNSDLNLSKAEVATSRSLVVGNIHVLYSPNRGDVKLGQIRLFLEKAHRLSAEWGGIPIVLAGDLNSVPQSAIYEFISSAKLDILQHKRKDISGQIDISRRCTSFPFLTGESFRQRARYKWNDEELKLATGSEQITCLQHHLNLHSAYPGVPGNGRTRDNIGEPLATSCHSKFMGTVDYIWHSEALLPIRVLETLPVNALQNMGGLPSEIWGSDHLALVCEFAFMP